jgi:hypothetical protein
MLRLHIDPPILIVSALFFVPGFALLWWQVGLWTALGVLLIVIGSTVKRTQ